MTIVWIHTPSVGEYITAKPLLKYLKQKGFNLIISYSSPRAQSFMKKQTLGERYIRFSIKDLVWGYPVKRFISEISPHLFIVVESDRYPSLWGAPVPFKMLVNARISIKSFRFMKTFRFIYRNLLNSFNEILCKDINACQRFQELGVSKEKLRLCGNLKLIYSPPDKEINIFFPKERKVFVAGSTHNGEERIIFKAFAKLKRKFPNSVLVIAPRHIDRAFHILQLARQYFPYLKISLRSKEKGLYAGDILIVDTLGELYHFYKLSSVSFVGGSLVPVGGHNLFEPAFFGKPVLFGPYVEKFLDLVKILEKIGLAFPIKDESDIFKTTLQLFEKPPLFKINPAQISKQTFLCYKNEIEKILSLI